MTINIAHVEYKTLKKHILVIIALFFSTLVLVSNANAVEPVLVLDPSMGDPPSVGGTLSGSGWLCDSGLAPTGSATFCGAGVVGSAAINRDGSLIGIFTPLFCTGHFPCHTCRAESLFSPSWIEPS